MKVALTGANGFIGSHILTELHSRGHQVTALVRDDAQAGTVAASGATPVVVDLYDRPAVTKVLDGADGAIHTASPGDATSADLDDAVVDAAIESIRGHRAGPTCTISGAGSTDRTRDHRGVRLQGAGDGGVESADRGPSAQRRGNTGRSTRLRGRLWRGGGGIPGLLLGSPRDAAAAW